ncbi:MAG: MauE/DoxX family redox-associated membrane protein, partial [Gemmatimonadales bacterium]
MYRVDVLLICARGGLALVFIAAGVGKLLDPVGSRRALRDFGVPRGWAGPGAWLLPIAELAAAAALLTQALARVGAVASLLLLAAFALGVANALRQGRAPDCHCFGQLHSAPAGRGTLVRNLALGVPAALVVVAVVL